MKFLTSILFVLLVGCAASGPMFVAAEAPSQDQALIYVYRVNDQFGQLVPTQIIINDTEVAKLPNNAYIFSYVPAGVLKLYATRFEDFNYSEKRRVVAEGKVTGGETYYFKVRTEASVRRVVTFVSVEYAEQGKKDLEKLRLSVLSK